MRNFFIIKSSIIFWVESLWFLFFNWISVSYWWLLLLMSIRIIRPRFNTNLFFFFVLNWSFYSLCELIWLSFWLFSKKASRWRLWNHIILIVFINCLFFWLIWNVNIIELPGISGCIIWVWIRTWTITSNTITRLRLIFRRNIRFLFASNIFLWGACSYLFFPEIYWSSLVDLSILLLFLFPDVLLSGWSAHVLIHSFNFLWHSITCG